jgi:preprotein translocase subunit SecG
MAVLYPLLIVVHILICASLIIVVLLQSSKGEGLAGAFGGGGLSGAVFGGRGAATFLSKATTVLAVGFMLSSVGLTFVSLGVKGTGQSSGVIQNLKTGQSQALPETPSTVPGAPAQGTTQPGTTQPGATQPGSNLFNQPPAGQAQQPATQPQTPATKTPPATGTQTPATQKPGATK